MSEPDSRTMLTSETGLALASCKEPPGLGLFETMLALPRMQKRIDLFLQQGVEQFGEFFRVKAGVATYFVLSNPDTIQQVLEDDAFTYEKGRDMQAIRPIAGNGLFLSFGELWKRQRRIAQPTFHPRRLSVMAKIASEGAQSMMASWPSTLGHAQHVNVSHQLFHLTLFVISKSLLHEGVSEAAANTIGKGLTRALEYLFEPNAELLKFATLPTPAWFRYRYALHKLNKVIHQLIESTSDKGTEGGSYTELLRSWRDPQTGAPMHPKLIRDELATMLLAGHETTATTLSWALYLLARHPEVQSHVRLVVRDILGTEAEPSYRDVANLKPLQHVLLETLRLYPPIWGVTRTPKRDVTLSGYRVPAGSIVSVSPWLMHHSAQHWAEPEAFRPERFADSSGTRHRYAYFPFGGGPRQCIGSQFALTEATLVLASILQRFRVCLPKNEAPVLPKFGFTLRPNRDIELIFERV